MQYCDRHLRRVSAEEGVALAEREGLAFMETSALTRENVDKAFLELMNQVCPSGVDVV